MAAATSAIAREYSSKGEAFQHEVLAGEIIYQGAAIGEDSSTGYARALQAGDAFLGFAYETCDNSSGSSGDKRVKGYDRGEIRIEVASLARGDVNVAVYLSSDNDATKTSSSNSRFGTIKGYIDATYAWVSFEAAKGV